MELRQYGAMLSRQWWVVVVAVLAAVGVAAAVVLASEPVYRAESRVFVSTQLDAGNTALQLNQGGNFAAERVRSYEQVATSPRVLTPVITGLSLPFTAEDLADAITADAPASTAVITISVRDASAVTSARIADAVAAELGRAINEIETPSGGTTSPVKTTVLAPATVPTTPVSPNVLVDLALGLLVGLVLGLAAAVLRESVDTRLRTVEDLSEVTDLPVLAAVTRDPEAEREPVARRDPWSTRREAFRQLRTNVQFAAIDSRTRVVMVTSPAPAEGKSVAAGNLAVAAAAAGMSTCLVDADLRRPSVADYLGLVGDVGLTGVLVGSVELDEALQPVEANLVAITAGALPPNPNELLASERATALLTELAGRFDLVVVDSPPVLAVGDAGVLGSKVDGVVMVVRAGATTRVQLSRALEALQRVNARIYGLVLNMLPPARSADHYGYYAYSPVRPAGDGDEGDGGSTVPEPAGSETTTGSGTGPATNGSERPRPLPASSV